MKTRVVSCFLLIFTVSAVQNSGDRGGGSSSIAFATWLRSSYSFDIYSIPTSGSLHETRLTDGVSVNFNGYFPTTSSVSSLPRSPAPSLRATHLVYVSERNGSSGIYLDSVYDSPVVSNGPELDPYPDPDPLRFRLGFRSLTESGRNQILLVGDEHSGGGRSMKDRPSLIGQNLIYVSTHEDPSKPRESWTAVYSTDLHTGATRRLTPKGVADFSPTVSPSGIWTAVASYGEKGWQGEIEELGTDIYVFLTEDGSKRIKIVDHGGWPSWATDSTLYFHRRSEDGWWSVYRASFSINGDEPDPKSVSVQRITRPGFHAFTAAASPANTTIIAVVTRRRGTEFRHVELYDVLSRRFIFTTRSITPNAHHFNPFISPDSLSVGYHKCKGASENVRRNDLVVESIRSPIPDLSLVQIDGSFPSYSPDGRRIAFVKLTTEPDSYGGSGLYVMNTDGTRLREVLARPAFATAWDPKRNGVVYTSVGPIFAGESAAVDIVSVDVDSEGSDYKVLTQGGRNNAFPSPSPDGKRIVFRSGRSGYKNLYIMDAVNGEIGYLRRLTDGPWTDTMCNWSPDGDWIVFSSNREDPNSESFQLFKIHPNGTGVQKLMQSGTGGRINHPWFSPDGNHIVFVSDYAGVSAEPISNPHHFQPYGDVFVIKSDGSDIHRITHNSYEDGTTTWSPVFAAPVDAEWPHRGAHCSFQDSPWLN